LFPGVGETTGRPCAEPLKSEVLLIHTAEGEKMEFQDLLQGIALFPGGAGAGGRQATGAGGKKTGPSLILKSNSYVIGDSLKRGVKKKSILCEELGEDTYLKISRLPSR